jgi:YVTN family beta-propeller protein
MPRQLLRSRALLAGLTLVVSGALSQVAAGTATATTSPSCTDSWASPVSGAWTNPADWTNGVPASGAVACITVAGNYQVTLPSGDTFVTEVVLGDGTGAGQESLLLPGCRPTGGGNNRLYLSTLDVAPGGVLNMQNGQSCPGSQAGFTSVIGTDPSSAFTLGGTVLTDGILGGGLDFLYATAITNTGTITDNSTLSIDSLQTAMTFDNRGVINGSASLGLELPENGVTMTNEGSIQGGVLFSFTSGQLGSTGSTFANNTGGDIATGGLVQMNTGTTFIQNAGTMSGGFAVPGDGGGLDVAGSGQANFEAVGTVSLTGDLHPGQELDILGQSWSTGLPCGSPVNSTVNATGSFSNGGIITLRSAGNSGCPPGTATLTVPTGDVLTNQGTINASQYNAVAGRTISGAVDNAGGTINVDPGVNLAISPGSLDNAGTVNVTGTLAVTGNYTQEAAGTTSVAAGSKFGTASLSATGSASLAGTLALAGDGVTPPQGSSATLLSAGSVTGTFGTVTGTDAGNGLEYQVGYTTSKVTATVTPAKPPRAYVTRSSGSLAVIDRSTNTLLTTINAGGPGDAVAVTPDGSRVYVADDKNRLDVFNTAAGTLGSPIPLGGSPDAVAVSPDGSTMYAVDAVGHLDVIDAASGTVSSVVKVGGIPEGVVVSPDGSAVYVANASGRLDVVSTATDTVKSVIKVGGRPSAVAVSPSGSTVYLASATGQLIAVDPATGTVTARVKTGGLPDAVAVSPVGTSVYLADATGHLVTVAASTAKVTRRVAVAGAPNGVAVSPDGATVYVIAPKATKLYVIAAATGKIQARVPIGGGAAGVAVS